LADRHIVAKKGGIQIGRLNDVAIAGWIVLGLVALFAVLFLTIGPKRHLDDKAMLLGVGRDISPDGTLVLAFRPIDRGYIHEGTRITFHAHRVGRVVEVDPGEQAILVRMVFRRGFIRKANAMRTTLTVRHSRNNPSVTHLVMIRG
jgi:hypothetical protein